MEMKNKLFDNFSRVSKRIESACDAAGRNPQEVTLVAVSKGVFWPAIEIMAGFGVSDFGENRIQEAAEKMAHEPQGIRWHLIGHLQSNKAAKALELGFKTIQSVGSLELAQKLGRLLEPKGQTQGVLLEVNIAKESQKHGWAPEEIVAGAKAIGRSEGLKIVGLMCMGPQVKNQEEMRPYFQAAKKLHAELENLTGEKQILSMGMSQDFETAIQEGTTMVRLGTVLFAPYGSTTK